MGVEAELLSIELPAEPASIARARHAVSAIAGPWAEVADVALAVSEAVTNAVCHGYRGGLSGTVAIRATAIRGRLQVEVADDGVGMSPHPEWSGLGMGLAIIGKLASAVQIEDASPGVRVCMVFERG